MTITIADLEAFGREHNVVWGIDSMPWLTVSWQTEVDKGGALLTALEERFGVRWPAGRVGLYLSREYPERATVTGEVDAGLDGRLLRVIVTLFDRQATPDIVRRVEV